MKFTLDNFVRSVLAVDATAADTSLVLTLAAPPARDPPAPAAGEVGVLGLQDSPAAPTKIEIVTYTGQSVSGTQVTLTGVTRGCEGTTAQAWTTGTPTFAGTTAAVMGSKADKGTTLADYGITDGVPNTRKVNGKALSADVTLTTSDIGAEPALGTGTLAQYLRGDKTWRDLATDVRAAVLTGLSTATNAAVVATDSVLAALGKLQAQVSAAMPKAGGAFTGNISAPNLSGTNTGDQDLSGYAPAANPGFTGTATFQSALIASATTDTGWLKWSNATNALNMSLYGSTLRFFGGGAGTMTYDVTTGALVVPGTLSAPNIGPRNYVQSSDPGAVPDGSLWVW